MQTFPRVNLYLAFFIAFFTWAIYQVAPDQVQDVKKNSSLTGSPEELPLPLPANTKIHDAHSFTKKITVRSGDNLASIFKRNGISSGELQKLEKSNPMFKAMKTLRPGERLNIERNLQGQLLNLKYIKSPIKILSIGKRGDTFDWNWELIEQERLPSFASGLISNKYPSLYQAGKEYGLSDKLIMELAELFQWDISFALDLRSGDSFSVIYEKIYVGGIEVGAGKIIAASFSNMKKQFYAVAYKNREGKEDHYDSLGRPLRKAFIRDPVHFSHVSSSFNLRRMHPIHKRIMPHRGIDYAAQEGTPVLAASDGNIVTRSQNSASGKFIVIKHGKTYVTKYLHLSRFGRGVYEGARVNQGQVIGYVGATGWATAPHLHYEFLVDGVHRNPRKVKLPKSDPIPEIEMETFKKILTPMTKQLKTISLQNYLGEGEKVKKFVSERKVYTKEDA
ncbi:MAG: peptidoglycan DD-metalloendopeptidase family protein [Pseudomonadota bacterium]|nr:peptidoglycan DD-metalloendopeptidase family protein [Pseudomonadota bacterium]